MTTVFVSKRLGLAMTDSRVTYSTSRYLAGVFPLTPSIRYGVVNQKALYIHDRLFLASGDVKTITYIMQYLVSQIPVQDRIDKDTPSCDALLIGKDYAIHMTVYKGKFRKRTIFFDNDWVCIMGSGSPALSHMLYRKYNPLSFTTDYAIQEFSKVKDADQYTDDNINLYRI